MNQCPASLTAEIELLFRKGISRESDLLELGSEYGILDKAGSWYSYGEMRLGQGKESARRFLEENPELADKVEMAIFERASPKLTEKRREQLELARSLAGGKEQAQGG